MIPYSKIHSRLAILLIVSQEDRKTENYSRPRKNKKIILTLFSSRKLSESFRNLYPSQCKSVRTNPKKCAISFVENRSKINPTSRV